MSRPKDQTRPDLYSRVTNAIIADLETDQSECVLIDAKNIAAGPVCRIILPERICAGTHSVWANGDDIGMGPNSILGA